MKSTGSITGPFRLKSTGEGTVREVPPYSFNDTGVGSTPKSSVQLNKVNIYMVAHTSKATDPVSAANKPRRNNGFKKSCRFRGPLRGLFLLKIMRIWMKFRCYQMRQIFVMPAWDAGETMMSILQRPQAVKEEAFEMTPSSLFFCVQWFG